MGQCPFFTGELRRWGTLRQPAGPPECPQPPAPQERQRQTCTLQSPGALTVSTVQNCRIRPGEDISSRAVPLDGPSGVASGQAAASRPWLLSTGNVASETQEQHVMLIT